MYGIVQYMYRLLLSVTLPYTGTVMITVPVLWEMYCAIPYMYCAILGTGRVTDNSNLYMYCAIPYMYCAILGNKNTN